MSDGQSNPNFEIIKINSSHLEEIAKIERAVFGEPWSAESLALLLEGDNAGFAARLSDGSVVAYAGMVAVLDEGQITNVATLPEHRRRGLGRALVEAIIAYAKEKGLASIVLEVRNSNFAAVELYRSMGFSPCGLRKDFYRFPTENALIMVKRLNRQ